MSNDINYDSLRKSYAEVVSDLTRISDEYFTELNIYKNQMEHLIATCYKFQELSTELYEVNETIKNTKKGNELKATLDNVIHYFMHQKNLEDLKGGSPVLPVRRAFIPNKMK